MNSIPLSPEDYLKKQDKLLGKLISIFGTTDHITEKKQIFDSLAKTVISQQLSNSASNSITKRIELLHGKRPFKAAKFLALGDDSLRECGISYGKIKTIKGIAKACLKRELTYLSFKNLTEEAVLEKLTSYWGIGSWTAEIFMMFSLKRLDILPLGDAGLQRAHKALYPDSNGLELTAEKWRPYRAIASVYLWKYLDNPHVHNKIHLRNRS